MSESASVSTGIAERYATAVFELVKEQKGLKALESDVEALESALAESEDLRALIGSPIYNREQQSAAMAALAKAMNLSQVMANTLGLMASKRRLFALPQLLRQLRAMIAADKGEVTAEVVAAQPLSKAQADNLAKALKGAIGKKVKVKSSVDESLIGGLVVKVGSKMIDTSIRSKLAHLQNAMKEVG